MPESSPPQKPAPQKLTAGEKALFSLVFGMEILFFAFYSGCTLLFLGMAETPIFLIPIPFLLMIHIQAYRSHRRWQETGSPDAKTSTWVWLFLPFVLIIVAWGLLASFA
jgi:hypothetical protein